MKLLTENFESEFKCLAEQAIEIRVIIAFLTEAGLGWLPLDKYPLSHFIVGVDLGITSPAALKHLQIAGADVQVYADPRPQCLFHPKVIFMRTVDSEYLIVGSNNLTARGISSNHEVSVLIERDERSAEIFIEFFAYYERLLSDQCCYPPDDQFFSEYRQTGVQAEMSTRLRQQKLMPRIDPAKLITLGDFLRTIAREFPRLERRRGNKIADHPLKKLNDEKFQPLFADIVERSSNGQLEGFSTVNIGGNWMKAPSISAQDQLNEPWGNIDRSGATAVRIHFADEYAVARFSFVLQYSVHISDKKGVMSDQARRRYDLLSANFKGRREDVVEDVEQFKVFDYVYKDVKVSVWSMPVLTFEYRTDSLPCDEQLYRDLVFLSSACIEAVDIE